MYLLDTVVVSELNKRRRNAGVMQWFERQRPADLLISVISVGEIERGIARQKSSNPEFAAALAAWLDRVLRLYQEQILPFDLKAARRWGMLSAALGNESADLMIAATALEQGLTLVTRNVSDFEPTGASRSSILLVCSGAEIGLSYSTTVLVCRRSLIAPHPATWCDMVILLRSASFDPQGNETRIPRIMEIRAGVRENKNS